MPEVNLTRKNRLNEKRDISVFAARLKFADLPTSGDVYQLFSLPANSLVIANDITVVTPFDSATSATADIGIAGGAEFMGDGDLTSAAGATVAGTAGNKLRPTGGTVTLTPTYDGVTNEGEVVVRVHYVELDKVTGHLTQFVS